MFDFKNIDNLVLMNNIIVKVRNSRDAHYILGSDKITSQNKTKMIANK